MTIQDVQQAYMAWKLAVGTYEYARKQGDHQAIEQAEQAMLDHYADYLLTRDRYEKGGMPAA
jgi:hypothetical protein